MSSDSEDAQQLIPGHRRPGAQGHLPVDRVFDDVIQFENVAHDGVDDFGQRRRCRKFRLTASP
ncbi:MAG: hypothetical protein U5K56_07060 [Halioglobus sp.]|nr:hypothetical protein [Halioglobus sp.]